MTHTVVGLFDEKSDAQSAMNELVEQGFVKENIDLSNKSAGDDYDSSADAGAGIGDKIANFFNSLFSDEETAQNYTNAAGNAEAILTVQVDSDERAATAQEILDRNGAIDAGKRSGQDFAATNNSTVNRDNTKSNATIPVVEESLNVGKREVESGGARIRSRIIEKPVEESIRLREEHVVVNRRPADREISQTDLQNFQPGEMEITEHSEVPIVGKQARVVEEVEIGKTVSEREETIRDTVRSTDVDVEEFDGETDTMPGTKARGA